MTIDELEQLVQSFLAEDDRLAEALVAEASGDDGQPGRWERGELARVEGDEKPYRCSLILARPAPIAWNDVLARFGSSPANFGPDRDAWGGPNAHRFRVTGKKRRGVLLLMMGDIGPTAELHGLHLQRFPAGT